MIQTNGIRNFLLSKDSLNRLILINLVFFIMFLISKWLLIIIAFLMNDSSMETWNEIIVRYLAMPAYLPQIIQQPWSIITSLFFHATFWHLFFNMVMLYMAGRIFMLYLKESQLLIVYLLGGLFGNAFYIIAYNLFPAFESALPMAVALGASGAIMAILATITVYKPNHEIVLLIFGKITLKWLMLIFVIIDLMSIPKGNAGGHIAHLGGALFGAIYALTLKNRRFQCPIFFKQKNKKHHKFSTSFETGYQARNMNDEEYNANKKRQQQRIDEILDKISKAGYEVLSKDEKEFLFFYSKHKQG